MSGRDQPLYFAIILIAMQGHLHWVVVHNLIGYSIVQYSVCMCVCVFSSRSFLTSSSLDVPAGVTQEEGHTGFLIHLLSEVRALRL